MCSHTLLNIRTHTHAHTHTHTHIIPAHTSNVYTHVHTRAHTHTHTHTHTYAHANVELHAWWVDVLRPPLNFVVSLTWWSKLHSGTSHVITVAPIQKGTPGIRTSTQSEHYTQCQLQCTCTYEVYKAIPCNEDTPLFPPCLIHDNMSSLKVVLNGEVLL